MKRIALALIAMIFAVSASAQDLRWGPTAAINFSSINGKNFNESDCYLGFNLGAKVEMDFADVLTDGFYLEGKFMYTLKGGRWKNYHENLGYLELPVNLGYRYPVSQSVSLMGSLGPYFALGVLGKSVNKAEGQKIKTDIFGKSYKRFDFGLNYNLGVELWNQWQFFIGIEHSLTNMAKTSKISFEGDVVNTDIDVKARLFNFYIGTAFMF